MGEVAEIHQNLLGLKPRPFKAALQVMR